MKRSISFQQHIISYKTIGCGPRFILAMHGVGQDCSAYDFLEGSLDGYTLIVPDLPFHGDTRWRHATVTEEDMTGLVRALMQEHRAAKIHLAAYSIGAKVAGVFVRREPEKVLSLMYIAPDGIKERKLYILATRTLAGRLLFRAACAFPAMPRLGIRAAGTLGLVKKADAAFMTAMLKDRGRSEALYRVWTGYSKLRSRTGELARQIQRCHIPFTLVTGRFDVITPPQHMGALTRGIGHVRHIVLPRAHNLLGKSLIITFVNHFRSL